MMECPRCILIRDLAENEEKDIKVQGIDVHRNIDELESGLRESCWWCTRIVNAAKGYRSFSLLEIRDSGSFRTRVSKRKFYYIRVMSDRRGYTGVVNLTFEQFEHDSVVNLGSHTDCSHSWQYIARRLADCESSHASCGRRSGDLPTWLIKIDEPRSSKARCHLVKSADEPSIGRYVTMSHRWQADLIGDKKLVASTLDEYQCRIPMEELPKHYGDAVEATSKLNIKYLWIDFLVCRDILAPRES
jgi:hypothetical protein